MRACSKLIAFLAISFLFFNTTNAQTVQVKGVVLGPSGPLQDVTVKVSGKNSGTTTDVNGRFSIQAAKGSRLIFSSVGYLERQMEVTGGVMNLSLSPTNEELSEVIVTGYSAQSKKSITGSVVTVKSELIKALPVTNVNQALQGRVAGLTIISDGSPQGNVSVRIRGVGTINGSDPLYVIDGVPTTSNLNQINPADIESASVLKDASAASVYGARAANGVVLIETKKGKVGQKPSLSFDTYVGLSAFPNRANPELLNTRQYANSLWQSQRNSGITNPTHPQFGTGADPMIPDYINPVGSFEGDPNTDPSTYDVLDNQIIRADKDGTNWFDALTRSAITQNYNIGVRGGGIGSRYAFSFGYLDRQGPIIFTGFKRYNTRINTEFSLLNNKLKIGENINFAYANNTGRDPAYNIYQVYYTPPIMPVYDIMGNFSGTRGGALALGTNYPNGIADQTRHQDDRDRFLNVLGNIYASYDILPNLTFKSSIGAQLGTRHSTAFYAFSPEVQSNGQTNDLTETTAYNSELIWGNTLNYNVEIGSNHHLSALIGTEAISLRGQGYGASRRALFSTDLAFRYLITSSGLQTNTADLPVYSNLFSLFGKVDYSFKDKYFLNATLRRDGSSRFATGNKYEVFPAFGAAWVVSDEGFFKSTVINSLKLRAGLGQTGNQGSAGDFSFAEQFGSNPAFTGYDIGATQNSIVEGFARTVRGNPDLRWERNSTLNIGADLSMLHDKVSVSLEWYQKNTRKMLVAGVLPGSAGLVPPPLVNIGKVRNTGVDASLGYRDVFGQFTLDALATIFTYKNKLVDIDGNPNTFLIGGPGEQQGFATRNQAGHPVSSFYGFIADGVIQDGPEAGNFNFRDLDKNGEITDDDRTYIGSPHPDFQYSLNVYLKYKNFDLSVFLIGSQGNEIFNFNKYYQDFDNRGNWNRSVSILNAWTPENHSNSLAQYNAATAGLNSRPSTYFIEDGSYLRCQNLQFGYNFHTIGVITNLRIYLQSQNLFVITKYTGVDPEIGRPADNLGFGVDNGDHYPISRTFLVGVNLGF